MKYSLSLTCLFLIFHSNGSAGNLFTKDKVLPFELQGNYIILKAFYDKQQIKYKLNLSVFEMPFVCLLNFMGTHCTRVKRTDELNPPIGIHTSAEVILSYRKIIKKGNFIKILQFRNL